MCIRDRLTGYLSGAEIIAQTWGGALIYQLILVYALCQGIIDCGAGDVIARYLITRKWAQGKPKMCIRDRTMTLRLLWPWSWAAR